MADTRELILKRLLKLAAQVDAIGDVRRLDRNFNTEEGAAIVLFDGSEQRVEAGSDMKPKDGRVSSVFSIRPEFHVFLQAAASDAGKALSKIRASAISTVVEDDELRTLAGPNGWVRYMGSETSAERGRAVEVDMALVFEIGFVLSPQRLTGA
jgi:hypothetical protein